MFIILQRYIRFEEIPVLPPSSFSYLKFPTAHARFAGSPQKRLEAMSLPENISRLWESICPVTITPDDVHEMRAEASRCLIVHGLEIFKAKPASWWNNEGK